MVWLFWHLSTNNINFHFRQLKLYLYIVQCSFEKCQIACYFYRPKSSSCFQFSIFRGKALIFGCWALNTLRLLSIIVTLLCCKAMLQLIQDSSGQVLNPFSSGKKTTRERSKEIIPFYVLYLCICAWNNGTDAITTFMQCKRTRSIKLVDAKKRP